MRVSVGDRFPSVTVLRQGADGLEETTTDALLAGRRVVLFATPGAFTPACALRHLPGYVDRADAFFKAGVDRLICMAVNDPFVMQAWAEQSGATDKILMLPDGNGDITRELGLEMDGRGFGLGTRSERFAMILEDGVIGDIQLDEAGAVEVSAADNMLERLHSLTESA